MGHKGNCHVCVVGASTHATPHLYLWQVGISTLPCCLCIRMSLLWIDFWLISLLWVFSVWIQMLLRVKRWVIAMMAPLVEGKVTGNPENIIASLPAPARGRRRPANPSSAYSMWANCIPQSLVAYLTPSSNWSLRVSLPHVIRFVILVTKWWNASWRPITTKWWHSNLIWTETHPRK